MIHIRPFARLGHADHGWLDAHHHFSFAGYHDPARMSWGSVRVWNDDEIAAHSGFPAHSHRDMEILTYVRTGAITHTDSLGNSGRTAAGDVQVMSAGTGVEHSEFNREDEITTLFQIWIVPRAGGGAPRWDMKAFPEERTAGGLTVLASGFEADIAAGALMIRSDARFYGATLADGATLKHQVAAGMPAYLVVAEGALELNGAPLSARDAAAIDAGEHLTIIAHGDTRFLMAESVQR